MNRSYTIDVIIKLGLHRTCCMSGLLRVIEVKGLTFLSRYGEIVHHIIALLNRWPSLSPPPPLKISCAVLKRITAARAKFPSWRTLVNRLREGEKECSLFLPWLILIFGEYYNACKPQAINSVYVRSVPARLVPNSLCVIISPGKSIVAFFNLHLLVHISTLIWQKEFAYNIVTLNSEPFIQLYCLYIFNHHSLGNCSELKIFCNHIYKLLLLFLILTLKHFCFWKSNLCYLQKIYFSSFKIFSAILFLIISAIWPAQPPKGCISSETVREHWPPGSQHC
jgi:hypothetical protein